VTARKVEEAYKHTGLSAINFTSSVLKIKRIRAGSAVLGFGRVKRLRKMYVDHTSLNIT